MKFRFLAAALATIALLGTQANAQSLPPVAAATSAQPVPPRAFTPDPPPIGKRVTDLERENIALKARVTALEKKEHVPPAAAKTEAAAGDRWTVPQYPGVTFTRAQLTSMYPGRVAWGNVSGVAADPFDNCPDNCPITGCAPGCSTTLTTPAIGAGTPGTTLTYGLGRSARAGTGTGAGCAATSGGTSACAGGSCGKTGWHLGKFIGR